jgi:putative cell wall-binding protein
LTTGGTAGAAISGASLSGVTQPALISRPTVSTLDQAAGDLSLSLAGGTVTGDDTFQIAVEDNNGGTTLGWDGIPTFTVTAPIGSQQLCIAGVASGPGCPTDPAGTPPVIVGADGQDLQFTVVTGTAGFPESIANGETITLSGINLDVAAGAPSGAIFNTATVTAGPDAGLTIFPTSHPVGTLAGDGSTNGIIGSSPTTGAPTSQLLAVTTPGIAIGGSNQTAGNWNLELTSSTPGGETSINVGDEIHIIIADHDGKDCDPGTLADPDTVGFAATPSIDITAGSGSATAVPAATPSISSASDGAKILCAGTAVDNELTLKFTSSAVIEQAGPLTGVNIQITGVKYDVSGGSTITADQGSVAVAADYDIGGFGTPPTPASLSTTGEPSGPSNAVIGAITVVGNTPASDIQLNVTSNTTGSEDVNSPISPITLTESSTGALPAGPANGWVCVSLVTGGEWDNTTTAPTAVATNGMTVSAPIVLTTGPVAGDSTLVFDVTAPSSTGPSTITLGNLNVSVEQNLITDLIEGVVEVTYGGANPACGGGTTTTTLTKVFNVSGRVYGADADGTAAQAFDIANPGGNDTAVLATDTDPYDALSASYLAGQLGTGVLLTPTGAVSQETLSALRIAGVETVYAVGGPDAISQADITQLEATPSYTPGGVTERYDVNTNDVRLLEVQWIYGPDADGTAGQTAQFVGDHPIGTPEFQAAYGGEYNDTTGSSGSSASSAPDLGVNTAVLATDTGFQDAASASVMADKSNLPLLLTPLSALSAETMAALENDGIQQVLVMGGPDVIADTVLTQLEGMGISVLRIAGSDYTDTSAKAAAFELNDTNAAGQFDGLGYSTSSALGLGSLFGANLQVLSFARGDFYSDAIVSSQINAFLQSPELLSENPTLLGTPVTTFLNTEGNPSTAFGPTFPEGPGFSAVGYTITGGQAIFGGPVAFASSVVTAISTAIGPDQLPFP